MTAIADEKRLEAENGAVRSDYELANDLEEDRRKRASRLFGFPNQCFILLVVEICERFCFYGIRSILAVYLADELGCTQTEATSIYHMYIVLCYTTPIIGGMISDQYLGKFKTISYLSIVYIIGNAVISYGSYIIYDNTKAFRVSILGLLLIALGTGGIKPCVSAICGDQFRSDDTETLDLFFDIFYLCINVGSMISSFLTPKLRAMSGGVDQFKGGAGAFEGPSITPYQLNGTIVGNASELMMGAASSTSVEIALKEIAPTGLGIFCENLSGDENSRCYSVAFGLPSLLMVVALLFFWMGSKLYVKNPPNGSVIADFSISAYFRVTSKVAPTKGNVDKWTARPNDERMDTKRIFSMLAWILPIAGFWSIFDLAGTRFTYICKQVDSTIYSNFMRTCLFCRDTNWIKEDQVEAVNPLLLFCLVPLFNKFVFPFVESLIRTKYTRLHKMLTGMFMLILVNILVMNLQSQIDEQFTYIYPEDNDNSPMNHTSLIYQINYYNKGQYAYTFTDQDKIAAVHSKELYWNFRNYDDSKHGNAKVMPSNMLQKNGVTSERVWAKNDKKYFSKAIQANLTDQEQLIDGSTPFIDFSIYEPSLKFVDHDFLVRRDRRVEAFTHDNDPASKLSKVYLKNARFNKLIMFENGELHRVFQNEIREKNGQSRVDVYSLNENFISTLEPRSSEKALDENSNSNSKKEEHDQLKNHYSTRNGGFSLVCKNPLLGDRGFQDPFTINLSKTDSSLVNSTIAFPASGMVDWKVPFYKKQKTGNLNIWSFVVPQKSECFFTNYAVLYKDPEHICAKVVARPSSGSPSLEHENLLTKDHGKSCKKTAHQMITTFGARAIYSIIDFSDGEANSQHKLNIDIKNKDLLVAVDSTIEQVRLNVDFNAVTIPLHTIVFMYVILTSVEILISISGLSYSYEQAPDKLKAFISSLWLVPVALGNIIVVGLNHIEAFQVSVLSYFRFNVGFSVFIFSLYCYVTANYETKQDYNERKMLEAKELAYKIDQEIKRAKELRRDCEMMKMS